MHHARRRQIIAMKTPWWTSTWRDARRECRLRNQTDFSSSSGGWTTGNVLAWPRWKMRDLFRPNSAFGSRKARTDRVLAGKSWPHWLSGDTRLSAKEILPCLQRGPTEHHASRRIAESLHGEIIGNRTNPEIPVRRLPGFPSTNRHILSTSCTAYRVF